MPEKILVVGDAMHDRYWWGDVTRISPEAPVPVVAVKRSDVRMGAAANVAKNIDAMGGDVVAIFSPSFHERGGAVTKLRVVGKDQQMIRIDFDAPQAPVDLKLVDEALEQCKVVVISDYGKGSLANIHDLMALCNHHKAKVLVDPKGYRYAKYSGAYVVKPNMDEIRAIVGGWESEEELEHKITAMRLSACIDAILLTRGAEGMTLYADGEKASIAATTGDVVDPSGAGEAAISALAVAIAEDMKLGDAVRLANKAAGLAVQRFGTNVITREEVWS